MNIEKRKRLPRKKDIKKIFIEHQGLSTYSLTTLPDWRTAFSNLPERNIYIQRHTNLLRSLTYTAKRTQEAFATN